MTETTDAELEQLRAQLREAGDRRDWDRCNELEAKLERMQAPRDPASAGAEREREQARSERQQIYERERERTRVALNNEARVLRAKQLEVLDGIMRALEPLEGGLEEAHALILALILVGAENAARGALEAIDDDHL